MKNLFWILLAVNAIILSACGDKEPAVSQVQVDPSVQEQAASPSVQEQTTAMGSEVDATQEPAAEQSAPAAMAPADTAAQVVEAAAEEAGDKLAAAAGAAGLAGAMPGETAAGPAAGTGAAGVADAVPSVQDAAAGADLALGEKIYGSGCVACHSVGVAGAPKLGDAANWAPRIAQGMEVMIAHAINGFQGASGIMPPKGGFSSLTDQEVGAAVAYMASKSH